MTIKNNAEPANPHAQGIPKGQNATSYAAPTLEKQQKYDMRGPNSASQVTKHGIYVRHDIAWHDMIRREITKSGILPVTTCNRQENQWQDVTRKRRQDITRGPFRLSCRDMTWHHAHNTTRRKKRRRDMTIDDQHMTQQEMTSAWHEKRWHDTTWHKVRWRDMAWQHTTGHGTRSGDNHETREEMTWQDIPWHSMTCLDMTSPDAVQRGARRHGRGDAQNATRQ